jgi:adenylate cyclase
MKRIGRKQIYRIGRVLVMCASLAGTFAVGESGVFRYAENRISDTFFQIRDALFAPRSDGTPVVIVGIDRSTLSRYREPVLFWDKEFTDAIDAVMKAKPAAVGFDVLHLTTVGAKRHDFGKMKIGAKLMSTKRMVLPYAFDGDLIAVPLYVAKRFRDEFGFGGTMTARQNLRLLFIAERMLPASFGYANLMDDNDGIIRSAKLYGEAYQTHVESFPLKLYGAYLSSSGKKLVRKDGIILADGMPIPENLVIHYAGPPGSIPMVPLADCIDHKNDLPYLEKHFYGKVVLIGAYDNSLDDIHNTPYISSSQRTRGMYGVEIIAHTVDTLVRKRSIIQTSFTVMAVLCALFILIGSVLSRMKTSRSLLLLCVLEVAFLAGAFILFAQWSVRVSVIPAFALASAYFFGYLYEHYLLGKDRLLLRTVLNSYLDPRIVDRVVDEHGSGILRGQRRTITVLFADIRNFTTISESMNRPENVVDLLNIYLPGMSSVIYEYEGCVDKFIGDGIMAFWNAPNDVHDHAFKAVQCAIAMKKKLVEINTAARGRKLIRSNLAAGIGIHTGKAVVGNIGSSIKHDYTAIGDTVNTASRLEGKTKELGYPIIISDTVNSLIQKRIKTCPVGTVSVKGKAKKVKVYGINP